MQLALKPWLAGLFFFAIGSLLLVANGAVQLAAYAGHPYVFGLGPLLSVTSKHSVVDLYLSTLLLVCAALVGFVVYLKDRAREPSGYWAGLVILLLFLAVDTGLRLHDVITVPLRLALHATGLLYATWILPYGLALLAVGIVYLPFARTLPVRTRLVFVFAALCYMTGMMATEALAGQELMRNGDRWSSLYAGYATGGAALRLAGLCIFVSAVLAYLPTAFTDLTIRIGTSRSVTARTEGQRASG
jgi:hypothetical protein